MTESELNKFDEILTRLGTGRWNLLFILGIPIWAYLTPYYLLAPVYLVPQQNFTCIPDTNHALADPSQDFKNKCKYEVLLNSTTNNSKNSASKNETCTEFEYDKTTFTYTLTMQFDLVCDKEVLRATYSSTYFLGNLIGSLASGILSDKLGRKTVFFAGVIVNSITSVASVWFPTFNMILVARFIQGFCFPTTLTTGFTLALEVCEPKHRGTAGILMATPWALACMTWGALAFMIRDWKILQMVVSIPSLFYIPMIWVLDESPRWMIVNNKHEQAIKVLKRAERWNGSSLPPDKDLRRIMKEIQMESKQHSPPSEGRISSAKRKLKNIVVLFRTPHMRKITLLSYVIFIASAVIYYGMSLNGVNYTDDPFLYIILGGLMEIPAYTVTVPIINKFGRKNPTAIGYLLCGSFILCLAFVPSKGNEWIVMTLAMLGKLCIAASYQIFYLYGNELFPTEVRLQGFGSSMFLSNGFTMMCPFITELLAKKYPWVPSLLFGILGMVAGLATFCLPETLNKALPDTVSDLEQWRIQRKMKRINQQERNDLKEIEVFQVNGSVQ